jgi:hypothetical protein
MVIERIASVNQSYLNEPAIPKIGGEMKEGDSDHDDTVPKSDLELKNDVRKQVLSGLDLNGDGVVSQTEAIANTSKYNQADYLTPDENAIKNRILDQVLNGLDLNGDGVVSQAEAIANAGKYRQAVSPSQGSGKSKDMDLEQVLNGPGSDGISVDVLA